MKQYNPPPRNMVEGWRLLLFLLIFLTSLSAQSLQEKLNRYATINMNEWLMYHSIQRLSITDYRTHYPSGGGFYPMPSGVLIFEDGLVWAAKVHDGREPALRAGGCMFVSGVQPGWIVKEGNTNQWPVAVAADDPGVRIYRWRKDFFEIDEAPLKNEVALLLEIEPDAVTNAQIDTLRRQYLRHLQEWPAEHGAPYYDRNRNGKYDADYDEPGILGADQLLWYVVNDANEARASLLFGSPPIGLEVQVTAWAYKVGLSQVVFRRYRIINKSGFLLDSMLVGQYVNCDIGYFGDDLVGCDSSLSYGFAYNGYPSDDVFNQFSMSPPALGIVLLQGPIVPQQGATGIQEFRQITDYENLPMTSFWYHGSGMATAPPSLGAYWGTLTVFANLLGFADYRYGHFEPFTNGAIPTSPWPLQGNPLSGQGEIDGANGYPLPGARMLMVNSGPFSMEPGAVQELIYAFVAANPSAAGNHLDALANLMKMIPTLHKAYQAFLQFEAPVGPRQTTPPDTHDSTGVDYFILGDGYPNPFAQQVQLKLRLLNDLDVRLEVFNVLGQQVQTIYQGPLLKGDYVLQWDGKDRRGNVLPSGVYFVRLQHGPLMRWRKVILLK
ncbi:FlgD immunoglobulin-like domain containing protein [Calditrichota bacterium GD2]